ncbi:hypothetical protein LPJ53_000197 [Coemansia erecta]|uniref:Uncharacterized protein n=1 Tax=Coemansia erecta TaxID=147472 RepID=A0A9W7Y7P8_9FUNG|nr:hypothetical protein LPJ53_000197 [Coemansia erecta]
MDPLTESLVPTLAASLSALEEHQQALIERLRTIYTELAKGDGFDEELLSTLTYYTNQASKIQRRMMLIYARASDLKRRSERLREHRATQDKQTAEWMAEERSRQVPQAVPAYSNSLPSRSQTPSISGATGDAASDIAQTAAGSSRIESLSLPSSPVPKSVSRFSTPQTIPKSSLQRSVNIEYDNAAPHSYSGVSAIDAVGRRLRGLGIQAFGSSTDLSLPTDEHASLASRSSTPQPESSAAASSYPEPSLIPQLTTIKRSGKRKVRIPKIE